MGDRIIDKRGEQVIPMGKKIEELDKCVTLMEKTNRLFVTGVIDLETKESILDTCKATTREILNPVMPAQVVITPDPPKEEKKDDDGVEPDIETEYKKAQGKKKRH